MYTFARAGQQGPAVNAVGVPVGGMVWQGMPSADPRSLHANVVHMPNLPSLPVSTPGMLGPGPNQAPAALSLDESRKSLSKLHLDLAGIVEATRIDVPLVPRLHLLWTKVMGAMGTTMQDHGGREQLLVAERKRIEGIVGDCQKELEEIVAALRLLGISTSKDDSFPQTSGTAHGLLQTPGAQMRKAQQQQPTVVPVWPYNTHITVDGGKVRTVTPAPPQWQPAATVAVVRSVDPASLTMGASANQGPEKLLSPDQEMSDTVSANQNPVELPRGRHPDQGPPAVATCGRAAPATCDMAVQVDLPSEVEPGRPGAGQILCARGPVSRQVPGLPSFPQVVGALGLTGQSRAGQGQAVVGAAAGQGLGTLRIATQEVANSCQLEVRQSGSATPPRMIGGVLCGELSPDGVVVRLWGPMGVHSGATRKGGQVRSLGNFSPQQQRIPGSFSNLFQKRSAGLGKPNEEVTGAPAAPHAAEDGSPAREHSMLPLSRLPPPVLPLDRQLSRQLSGVPSCEGEGRGQVSAPQSLMPGGRERPTASSLTASAEGAAAEDATGGGSECRGGVLPSQPKRKGGLGKRPRRSLGLTKAARRQRPSLWDLRGRSGMMEGRLGREEGSHLAARRGYKSLEDDAEGLTRGVYSPSTVKDLASEIGGLRRLACRSKDPEEVGCPTVLEASATCGFSTAGPHEAVKEVAEPSLRGTNLPSKPVDHSSPMEEDGSVVQGRRDLEGKVSELSEGLESYAGELTKAPGLYSGNQELQTQAADAHRLRLKRHREVALLHFATVTRALEMVRNAREAILRLPTTPSPQGSDSEEQLPLLKKGSSGKKESASGGIIRVEEEEQHNEELKEMVDKGVACSE